MLMWSDSIMQTCVECRCLLAVTSLLVAFDVWEVGSQCIIRSRMGYQQQKKDIMNTK